MTGAEPELTEPAAEVVAPVADDVAPQEQEQEVPPEEAPPEREAPEPDRVGRGWGWPAPVCMALALASRLPLLGYPKVLVFDEVFYAPDAADTLQWGAEHGQAKHPPLGKWLIASGMRVLGFTPTGWRLASLLAGVLVVGLVASTVRRLTGRNGLAFGVGVLAAADGVLFTTGRLALLDAFVALFVMLTVWFLARAWTTPADDLRALRWESVGAVTAAGLGTSVKWSVAWVLPVVLGVLLTLDRRRRPAGRRLRPALATLAVALLLPPALYLGTWLPRQGGSSPLSVTEFVRNERSVARFHLKLRPHNANAAPATTWLWLGHPSVLFDTYCWPATADSEVGVCTRSTTWRESWIEALANPAVWAVCMVSVLGLAWLVVRRRLGVAAWLLLLAATQWVPWLLNPRASYSFYQASLIPVLLVGAGVVAARGRRRVWRRLSVAVPVLAVGLFALFYPIWTGIPIGPGWARLVFWLPGWDRS